MSENTCCSRRRLLQGTGAAAMVSSATALGACSSSEEPEELSWQEVILADQLELQVPTEVAAAGRELLVTLLSDSEDADSTVQVLSAACPHEGCRVGPAEDEFECPCHGSRFDLQGQWLSGPAQAPLVAFEARVSQGKVEARL